MTNDFIERKWIIDKLCNGAVAKHFVAPSTNMKNVKEFVGLAKIICLSFGIFVGCRYFLWFTIGLLIACYIMF